MNWAFLYTWVGPNQNKKDMKGISAESVVVGVRVICQLTVNTTRLEAKIMEQV